MLTVRPRNNAFLSYRKEESLRKVRVFIGDSRSDFVTVVTNFLEKVRGMARNFSGKGAKFSGNQKLFRGQNSTKNYSIKALDALITNIIFLRHDLNEKPIILRIKKKMKKISI